MASQGFKRKLNAILSVDVKGSSRLMGEDDEAKYNPVSFFQSSNHTIARDMTLSVKIIYSFHASRTFLYC
jgi:hypothetical protein